MTCCYHEPKIMTHLVQYHLLSLYEFALKAGASEDHSRIVIGNISFSQKIKGVY